MTGEHYAAQGNILVGGETVEAMARTYEESQGDLATRLLSALDAGQAETRGESSRPRCSSCGRAADTAGTTTGP